MTKDLTENLLCTTTCMGEREGEKAPIVSTVISLLAVYRCTHVSVCCDGQVNVELTKASQDRRPTINEPKVDCCKEQLKFLYRSMHAYGYYFL